MSLIDGTIFLFAHQDDEAFCFPFIKNELASGQPVYCIFLTTGSRKGRDELEATRNAESIGVLNRIGVVTDNIIFAGHVLNVEDGTLALKMIPVVRYLESLPQLMCCRALYSPTWEGGHPDHDAIFVISRILYKRSTGFKLFHYSLYNSKNRVGPFFRIMNHVDDQGFDVVAHNSVAEGLSYLYQCLGYTSQWRSWIGLLPFLSFHYLIRRSTVVKFYPDSLIFDFRRPHQGALYYEKRKFFSFENMSLLVHKLVKYFDHQDNRGN